MAKFEELIERVQDLDEDLAAEFDEFKSSSLRKKAGERDALEAKVRELEATLAERDAGPAREKAFKDFGVDYDALRPAERKLLAGFKDELTEEVISKFVEENELPLIEGEGEGSEGTEGEETPPAERVARAARTAGNNGRNVPQITPGDVAEWSMEKWIRFADANRDAAEALKRGETVTGVTA